MDNTHFGFEQVDKKDKEHLVREVFSSVAENYDLMNNIMSSQNKVKTEVHLYNR